MNAEIPQPSDRVPIHGGPHWYAVHTVPQGEDKADKNLRRQAMMTFYPFQRLRLRRKIPNQNRHRVEWVDKPYFPRYLFVALRYEHETLEMVNEADGVSTVVYTGGVKSEREYLRIPGRVMNALMQVGDGTGFISAEDMTRLSKQFFGKVGQKFRFSDNSAFAGLIGRIASIAPLDKTGEIEAFVQLFGGERKMRVSTQAVGELTA